jgi:hypothetical protein
VTSVIIEAAALLAVFITIFTSTNISITSLVYWQLFSSISSFCSFLTCVVHSGSS